MTTYKELWGAVRSVFPKAHISQKGKIVLAQLFRYYFSISQTHLIVRSYFGVHKISLDNGLDEALAEAKGYIRYYEEC